MSTFQGLELARKALFAQQGALYTTGHNIANVNTEGYSRQRVNFETTTPFPVPSRVQPQFPGQMGTGVEIGTVQRVRNQFLDFQFRAENSKFGYWETKQAALSRMEDLLNEPSENGLSKIMDQFWQSLQDLAGNPENSGARSVVAQRGLALAETFNHMSRSLQSIQADLRDQIENGSVKEINSLLERINDLNGQIQKIEPHGFLANDLYDERDRLIDQLSEHLNIKIHYRKSSESALDIADGIASIELLDSTGNSFPEKVFLIDAREEVDGYNEIAVQFDEGEGSSGLLSGITIGEQIVFGDGATNVNFLDSIGSLNALIEAHGYLENDETKGEYPETLVELNKLALEFANAFNEVHRSGVNLEDETARDFFVVKEGFDSITAESLTVNEDILNNSNFIAAGDPSTGSRNGDNALELAKVFDKNIDGLESSPRKFFIALIGELGVQGQKAQGMKDSTEILKSQVENSRMSVSAVSLDEEISNLIKFQHAYNAAARNMTAIDEMIDRIINQMGLVGR